MSQPLDPVSENDIGTAPEKAAMAEKLHRFFTASPHFPSDVPAAWDDGKRRFRIACEREIAIIDGLTLADYCKSTGSNIINK